MSWDAMSAAERDAARTALMRLLLPPSREALKAGLKVRRNPKFGWDSDEKRQAAEFEAMVKAALTPTP